METSINKIEIIREASSTDDFSKTFSLNDEDHTLANSLRYLIMKNPNVIFCGYTIPHPSEIKVNFRIQTNRQVTALEVLEKGLKDFAEVCAHDKETFRKAVSEYESNNPVQMEL